MLGCLVPSSCPVVARRAKSEARRAKSEAETDTQLTIFHLSALKKQIPIFFFFFYYPLKGWEQYDCVKKYLVKKPRAAPEPSVDINPILKAVKDILN